MPKNIIIATMAALLAVAGALAIVGAQSGDTADIEVRIWQRSQDHSRVYISARPAEGSWRTLGTIPLGRGQASEWATSGAFRYSDITLSVPLPAAEASAPLPDSEARVSGTGPTVERIDLAEGPWLCSIEWRNNVSYTVPGWFTATLSDSDLLSTSQVASELASSGRASARYVVEDGGDFYIQVEGAYSTTRWTFECTR